MINEKKINGVIVYIITIPFLFFFQLQWPQMGFKKLIIYDINIPFSAAFLIILIIFYFLGQLYQGNHNKISNEKTKFNKLCLLFVLMPVFSIILSKDTCHSLIYYLMDLLLPFLYFVILLRSINNIEDIKKVIFTLILSVFIYQFFTLYFMYRKGTLLDITTNLYWSNISTGFSSTLLPLLIPFQIAMYNLLKGWKKILTGGMLLSFIVYLIMSNYRTSLLAGILGFIVFYFYYYHGSFFKKLYTTGLVLFCVLISSLYFENVSKNLPYFRIINTFQQLAAGESLEIISSGRLKIWRVAWKMIYDFPFLGIGPDMWGHYIKQYSLPTFTYIDIKGNPVNAYAVDPHNLYLLIWINYGILNLVCFLCILFFSLRKGSQNIKRNSSKSIRTISLASFISLIVWIIMSFFTMRFFNKTILIYALIFWSIIAVILKLDEASSSTSMPREDLQGLAFSIQNRHNINK